jgi:hypothetical protein
MGRPAKWRDTAATRTRSMAKSGTYLRPELDTGSSRVFNCNDIARQLERQKVEDRFFFKNPSMNTLVFIKEPLTDERIEPHPSGFAVGTKLYIPYNEANVYEGGRSVFCHSKQLMEVLNQHFGFDSAKFSKADLDRDLKVLGILDKLPSLDVFLMHDALELDGLTVNERYFEIEEGQRTAIQDFIRGKIEPLVRAAYGAEESVAHRVSQLVDKIWEAKDTVALDSLIKAFRIPEGDAPAIFASWKGIIFYCYEYARTRENRENFARWLKDGAQERELVPKAQHDLIDQARRTVVERLREHWKDVESSARQYDSVYAQFTESSDPGNFIAFLRGAKSIYWRMGDSLSKMSHAVNCWDIISSSFPGRRLPSEHLEPLLQILKAILSGNLGNRKASAAA